MIVIMIVVPSNSSDYLSTNSPNIEERPLLFSSHGWIHTASADHGKEISIELNSATFMPLTTAKGNQVKLGVNYTTVDNTLIGNTINAVMKVYALNKTVIKSTSFPKGFIANISGTEEIKTTIRGNSTQNVTVVVQLTDSTKTIPISNPLQIGLNLTRSIASTTTPLEEPTFEIRPYHHNNYLENTR